MPTTNPLDLNNRIDALEKFVQDELKAWTDSGTKDTSGNPIILTDGAAFNAVDLNVSLEPKQSGSGTPSPTNVRPITGYTECVVDDHGANVIPMPTVTTIDSTKGGIRVQHTPGDDFYTYAGTASNTDINVWLMGAYNASVHALFLEKGTYYVKGVDLYDIAAGGTSFTKGREGGFYTLTEDRWINGVRAISAVVNTQYNETIYPYIIKVADTSAALPYEPYIAKSATIPFGQTVYGGSVDFKTGKVTVTHVSIASYNGETINEPWLSSIDEYVSGTTPTIGAQVVYPLTTPTELTLTPAELELLKGYNYISTNGTTIDLTYQPDNLKADILLTVSQLYGTKISIFDAILTGGDTGQVLTKTSDDNYEATWETLPATRTTTRKSEK